LLFPQFLFVFIFIFIFLLQFTVLRNSLLILIKINHFSVIKVKKHLIKKNEFEGMKMRYLVVRFAGFYGVCSVIFGEMICSQTAVG